MNQETSNEPEKPVVKKKKTIGDRLLTWTINIVLVGGLVYWIIGMRADQKQKFYQGIVDTATLECNKDRVCLDNLKARFKECASGYTSSRKSGKFNKEYSIDKEGFDGCLKETL